MVSWTCPHCGETYYSSWERRDEKTVSCDNCGADIMNPYHKERSVSDEKDKNR